ncbi:PREDICTED: Williams-Beuren syndrome chromosomal region 16 protein homolog [Polistes dominula]|uniref:Williams-Beuren syndrome chromosomal region 16 protein homolog n=1 Tax=Polistes dominula TaxID=743375 RepID=A0ABM1IU70_POLDO|nr:PREDICTED: Williams-Beuren syndrome chromosomal region 16 protein homolog [Polistes dominula]XP_015183755.1 PREDICTED: Williams-Beuren syndrome chromosomal region 16 protein homolog [Polistes dominula]XP_015183756.1 PREDICTED: Williams-Beuren syndrome chromosomal region 16 protein homolog [Polistes dominula]XP_015183757.1 PREDICTED: Williams-Beuren syndrome chromosomal region 16 protein homolog [Polistes dominula]
MLKIIKGLRKINKNIGLGKSNNKRMKNDILPVFKYPISKVGDRRVYVWGLAEHGALGTIERTLIKQGIAYLPAPRRLTFAERYKVTDIACGYGFTAFAVKSSDKNIIYGSGINTDSQLGFQEANNIYLDVVTSPRPINLPLKNSTAEVISVAAGRAHLLILTNEGLFTLGNNGYGQCGRPIIMNENYNRSNVVHHIPSIRGNRITAVTAGQDHSILLTESGEVYTFGWGADGQTGLAHYRNEHQPSLVKGDLAGQHIIKVACVADCVLALSDKGKVFGWGNSEYGQLLMDSDNYQVNIATELNIPKEIGHIVDIATGGCFCMILNSEGDVYVWGYGILGLGPKVERVLKPTLLPSTLFGNNAYSRNTKVSNIYCGISHLAAITNTGDLYMWGCNKFGSLGISHQNDQFFPFKVSVGAQVKKVACGIDHTVALCKPFI